MDPIDTKEKFVFSHIADDGTLTTIQLSVDKWFEAFPHFLNLMNGVGFNAKEVSLYAPGLSRKLYEDVEYLHFPEQEELEHSEYFYDTQRNR